MRVGVCDSDALFLDRIKEQLVFSMTEKGMCGQAFVFSDGDALLEYLESENLDLVFLNVFIGKQSGFDLARKIERMQPECEIAYCSDTLEYVTEAYETKHCYYILKAEMETRIPLVIDRAAELLLRNKAKICVYSNGKNVLVPIDKIMYAERNGKKSWLHLADGTLLETPEKIDELARKLVWPQFTRCHNSFVVSFEKMRTYTRIQLVMEDGREIPVSRPYLIKVRKSFVAWNKKNL